jgi:hypothetical protein
MILLKLDIGFNLLSYWNRGFKAPYYRAVGQAFNSRMNI